MALRISLAVAVCLVGVGCRAVELTGEVAFVSDGQRLCLLNAGRGTVRELASDACGEAPVWSPDGEWIAYTSRDSEGTSIRLLAVHDGSSRKVGRPGMVNRAPRWSPDGKKVAYAAGSGVEAGIWVYDLESGRETPWAQGRPGLMRPAWLNPRVIYEALVGGDFSEHPDLAAFLEAAAKSNAVLLAVGATGSAEKPSSDIFIVIEDRAVAIPDLVAAGIISERAIPSSGAYVEWGVEQHPKGKKIAFESNDGGDREIFVLDFVKGTIDITNHRAADWNPVWSPDGKWVAFESFRDGRCGVYRVYAGTVRVFPIAVTPDSDNWGPSWSPDGHWVAYTSTRTGNPEIFATDIASGMTKQLTDHLGDDIAPAWRPGRS